MENNENYDIFFWLSVIANLLQIENYNLNIKDAKNTEILKYLRHQDKILDKQINKYLKTIVKQNEQIIQQNEEIKNLLTNKAM